MKKISWIVVLLLSSVAVAQTPGWHTRFVRSEETIQNIEQARELLERSSLVESTVDVIDFRNSYPGGYGGSNFAMSASATLGIPKGTYTINIGSDDGMSTWIEGVTFDQVYASPFEGKDPEGEGTDRITWPTPRAYRNSGGSFTVDSGEYVIESIFFERTGRDAWKIDIAQGVEIYSRLTRDRFRPLQDGVFGISLTTEFEDQLIQPTFSPGDTNGDGVVGFSDFIDFTKNYRKEGGPRDGDFNNDGMVDFSDYLILSVNYGKQTPVSVPEPMNLYILVVFLLFVYFFVIRKWN